MDTPQYKSIKAVSRVVSRILGILLSALLCKLLYDYSLIEVFNKEYTYFQWLSSLIILNLLIVPISLGSITKSNDK